MHFKELELFSFSFLSPLRWMQGRMVHFLHCNLVFFRVVCNYMLLTWHKDNIFQICGQLQIVNMKKTTSIKDIVTYIHQIYSNGLLKLKNMDLLCIYIHAFLCMSFIWDKLQGFIYDLLKYKKHTCTKKLEKI